MEKGEKEKPRYGTVNFEKRKHPRFNVDLPVEYRRAELSVQHGHAFNGSEGGVILYLPEQIEIAEHLALKLFLPYGSKLHTTEILVQVVWVDIHLEKEWGDYRTGVRFADISLDDLNKIKNFLRYLLG
jgi:hypothetical protein